MDKQAGGHTCWRMGRGGCKKDDVLCCSSNTFLHPFFGKQPHIQGTGIELKCPPNDEGQCNQERSAVQLQVQLTMAAPKAKLWQKPSISIWHGMLWNGTMARWHDKHLSYNGIWVSGRKEPPILEIPITRLPRAEARAYVLVSRRGPKKWRRMEKLWWCIPMPSGQQCLKIFNADMPKFGSVLSDPRSLRQYMAFDGIVRSNPGVHRVPQWNVPDHSNSSNVNQKNMFGHHISA